MEDSESLMQMHNDFSSLLFFSGMLWTFASIMRGSWRGLTTFTWSSALSCCSWSSKRKSCRGSNKCMKSGYMSAHFQVFTFQEALVHLHFLCSFGTFFFPGESSLWIRNIQVCSSTTAPDRAARPTPWTNSSRREMSRRNSLQERGMRSHFSRYFIKD